MEFSSYFRTFGNPDFTAGFSGGGDVHQPLPLSPPCRDAARPPSLFHVPEVDAEETHHFLEECSLCGKALSGDIFMYRGDTPFCSEECRREQMEMDRAKYQQRKKQATAHATAAPKEHRRQQPPQKQRPHRIPVGS